MKGVEMENSIYGILLEKFNSIGEASSPINVPFNTSDIILLNDVSALRAFKIEYNLSNFPANQTAKYYFDKIKESNEFHLQDVLAFCVVKNRVLQKNYNKVFGGNTFQFI